MSKNFLRALKATALLSLASCTPPSDTAQSNNNSNIGSSLLQGLLGGGKNVANATAQTGGSILDHLVSSVMGNTPLTPKDLIGKWHYKGSDCLFESENLLAQAGGVLVAAQVESKIDQQLAKYGFKKGSSTFTFAPDGTFTATLGGRQISGTYMLDPKTRKLQLSALMGLFSLQPQVVRTSKGISFLFEADKLLSLTRSVATLVGKTDSTVGLAASLMENYKGMRLGLQFTH